MTLDAEEGTETTLAGSVVARRISQIENAGAALVFVTMMLVASPCSHRMQRKADSAAFTEITGSADAVRQS